MWVLSISTRMSPRNGWDPSVSTVGQDSGSNLSTVYPGQQVVPSAHFYKLLGHCLSCTFQSRELLAPRYQNYESKSRLSPYTRSQHKALPGHSLPPSVLQTLLIITKAHISLLKTKCCAIMPSVKGTEQNLQAPPNRLN